MPRSLRSGPARPFLGIYFDCCRVYRRIYKDPGGTAYRGRCPRCLKAVVLRVGPGGRPDRFFRAR